MSLPAAAPKRYCPCPCRREITPDRRADTVWFDRATCPQMAADWELAGFEPDDKPGAFWEGWPQATGPPAGVGA